VFVECVRADLVGRYQGETAMKVKDVVRSALGGILFIDEAYSLVNGEGDTFGIEAINTLVSEIENNRDNLAVVLAGYTEEMNDFLDSNPGLRSRLPRVLEFPDYTLDELVQIFNRDLEKRGYEAEMSDAVVRGLIEREMAKKDFGNARGVRNLVDEVIEQHNERMNRTDLALLSNDDILSITDEDAQI
jgi:SpoVK/Ycf46/Vps4 family AAA+-type ATPase